MFDPEAKRAQLEKWVKWGVVAIGLAVSAPIAFYALEGLIAWGAFALTALLFVNFAPVIGTWIANKRVAAMVAVIQANPIETMQNLLVEKTAEYQRQEDAVTEFDTQFRNVSNLVDGLKKTDPEEAKSYVEMRDKMKMGLDELRGEQAAAQAELKKANEALAKLRRIWAVAVAMNKALTASQSAQAKVFADMKQQVAVETVQTNLNRAFAKLDTAIERRKNTMMFDAPAKELGPVPEVIDITSSAKVKTGVTIN